MRSFEEDMSMKNAIINDWNALTKAILLLAYYYKIWPITTFGKDGEERGDSPGSIWRPSINWHQWILKVLTLTMTVQFFIY